MTQKFTLQYTKLQIPCLIWEVKKYSINNKKIKQD